jgi:hypothetical protein
MANDGEIAEDDTRYAADAATAVDFANLNLVGERAVRHSKVHRLWIKTIPSYQDRDQLAQ